MDIGAANWSETDDSNSTAAPDGAPEGMAPGGVNNTLRAIMGAIKRWWSWSLPKATAGTSTAYTLSYAVAPGALTDGMTHVVQFHTTSGASPTLNVNSLGAKPFYLWTGSAWAQVTAAGAIPAGLVARVSYNATEGSYRIISAAATGIGAAFIAAANAFTGNNTFAGTSSFSGAVTIDSASITTAALGAASTAVTQSPGDNDTSIATTAFVAAALAAGTSGTVVARAYAEYTSAAALTVNVPADDTIPQVTEGTEILSAQITPRSASNRIRVRAEVPLGLPSGASGVACIALFRNGGTNAIDARFPRLVDGFGNYCAVLEFEHVPGSTSQQTYSIRAGGASFNVYANGDISGRLGGGVSRATLVLEEIAA